MVLWQTFTQISLNGVPFFTGNEVVGPESQDDIWSAILSLTGLNKAQLAVLKAILVNHNLLNSGGEFDYAYNPPASAADRTAGTFAVGSDKTLTSTEDFGPYVDPLTAFESSSAPDGPNVWSLSFSATVFTIPEPPTWLMLVGGRRGSRDHPRFSAPPKSRAPSSRLSLIAPDSRGRNHRPTSQWRR